MKGSRISGLDDFLKSTENHVPKKTADKKSASLEELTIINFQIPVSLKKRICKYCIENDQSIREFLTELINEHFKKTGYDQ
jgi:hypothetical protein